jgi:hypothetical protein
MCDADFESIALDMFRFTWTYNPLYKQYLDLLQIDAQAVKSLQDIPLLSFLKVTLFKRVLARYYLILRVRELRVKSHPNIPFAILNFTNNNPNAFLNRNTVRCRITIFSHYYPLI